MNVLDTDLKLNIQIQVNNNSFSPENESNCDCLIASGRRQHVEDIISYVFVKEGYTAM